jgi:SpoVK/Ycf46/Vps4 family AAA+-type ATPase
LNHLSEVLKILDGALKSNASMAANYAGLLADKLQESGEHKQAKLIRERLHRAPIALAYAQDASRGFSPVNLPTDGESRLHTVDVSKPSTDEVLLLLPGAIQTRVNEFIESVTHYEALARAGATQPNRLLIYGPPGTGKTQTARWASAQLSLPLLTVRCDTLISSLLGQTSRNLRQVFEYSQQTPCVLFLDEFDALAGARGNERDVGELQRIVIALLQNIDALPDSTILIAATNHDQLLDPAIWRRFSFRLPLTLPDEQLRLHLWKKLLDTYAAARIDWSELARNSEGLPGAAIEQICLDTKRRAIIEGRAEVEDDELFRRLGLALAMHQGARLSNLPDEMRWLRKWNTKRFSLRTLAKLYDTTVRFVSDSTMQGAKNGDKKKHTTVQ